MTAFDGEECPVCGLPYCTGESGRIDLARLKPISQDAISWNRACTTESSDGSGLMQYVHTETDVSDVGDGGTD